MNYSSVELVAEASLPTKWGSFRILGFEGRLVPGTPNRPQGKRTEEAVVLIHGTLDAAPLLRVHSQCLTGDAFHSLRCDCRRQLELAFQTITASGRGLIIYEEQEGRGIGLMAKLRAYQLQDEGLDTVEANVALGYEIDHRDFTLPALILKRLGFQAVRLMTNNPAKVAALQAHGIDVLERIDASVPFEADTENYLRVKREKLGHLIRH